jgi:hypothetical protein
MKDKQIENLKAKKEAKLKELESNREVSVSSRLVAGGRVRIFPILDV